jgi:hypothetical protein
MDHLRSILLFNNTVHYGMSERLVEIPVEREIRDKIKQKKGVDTYSEFLNKLLRSSKND